MIFYCLICGEAGESDQDPWRLPVYCNKQGCADIKKRWKAAREKKNRKEDVRKIVKPGNNCKKCGTKTVNKLYCKTCQRIISTNGLGGNDSKLWGLRFNRE